MARTVKEKSVGLAIVSESGVNIGTVFPLTDGRLIIGRRVDASIPLEDSKVSRDHAVIDRRNGTCILCDLGSTNGTHLNGRKIGEATRIKVGDHIRVGNSTFKVDLYQKARDRSLHTHWNDVTRVDLQLEASSQRSVMDEDDLESSLELTQVQQTVTRKSRRSMLKKRLAFLLGCFGIIAAAMIFSKF